MARAPREPCSFNRRANNERRGSTRPTAIVAHSEVEVSSLRAGEDPAPPHDL